MADNEKVKKTVTIAIIEAENAVVVAMTEFSDEGRRIATGATQALVDKNARAIVGRLFLKQLVFTLVAKDKYIGAKTL